MLTGTIDFYHFTLFSLTFILHGDHKTYWSHFSHTCHFIRMKFDVVMKQFRGNILMLLLSKISQNKGNNCCFADCVKNINIGMHSDVYKSIWSKLGVMLRTIILYILILVHLTLTLNQGHKSARKQNSPTPIISQTFRSIWMEFGVLLRLLGVINLIWFRPFDIQWRQPYLCDFV